ncbi:glia maturation factor gamma-like [Liolophura sinensis]|uniref:glia maturation factor gamma-like n=1 Tax=Liolophura sinensis TaxID=3198878 RepID=UPI003158DBFB
MASDGSLSMCKCDPDVLKKCEKFRFRKQKTNAAIVLKIDQKAMTIVLDEEYEDCTVEEVQEDLPQQRPSYVLFSYVLKHDDGRVSYPLAFIFVSPAGCKPEQQMMYAGSKTQLVTDLKATKVFELRSSDEFTEEWLIEQLKR